MFKTYSGSANQALRGLSRYGFAASCFVAGAYLIASGAAAVVKR